MADIIPFQRRRPPREVADVRTMIEGALAVALDTVESLIAVLDHRDGDGEREDGGDAEPSLGAPEGHESQVVWLPGAGRDLEVDQQREQAR